MPLHVLLLVLVLLGTPASAGRAGASSCSSWSQSLLSNGWFSHGKLDSGHNMLAAATLSNDAYPWAKQFDIPIMDVIKGLTREQTAQYQSRFSSKYARLGARNVQFADYYSSDKMVAAHAVILGTSDSVFVTFRGTADLGQGMTSAKIESMPVTIFGSTLNLYQAPYLSVKGIFWDVLAAVRKALSATDSSSNAKVYVTGHSLGGASACLAALLLKEQGINIGGVYAFAPYKTGTTCYAWEDCWVSVYDRHLADKTWFIWNNQDPIPALVDNALGTNFQNSGWGHVPRDRHWIRIVGDQCLPASGTPLADICPPQVDAADGAADGVCSKTIVEQHFPWVYLQKVARCALLQGGEDDNARADMCQRSAVWQDLLGLSPPSIKGHWSILDDSASFAPSDSAPLGRLWRNRLAQRNATAPGQPPAAGRRLAA